MIEASVDNGDLQKVINRLSKYNTNVRQGVQREVSHSALAIQRMARENLRSQGAISTGRLRSSVRIRFTTDRMGAVIGTNVNYAAAVEQGQKPGHWPNVGDLIRWVKRKIIRAPKSEVRKVTFLVGRKIHDKGTPAKPYLFPAAKKQWPKLKSNLYKVLKMS
jgi:phage gpG-like protein